MVTWRTEVYGKWILAGEHAVLRGVPALVFPLKAKSLCISYDPQGRDELELMTEGESSQEMRMLFWGVLDRAERLLGFHRKDLRGMVLIQSHLPIGAGLGASATLCVGVCRWLIHLELLNDSRLYETARQLENLFHGESSGVDIAVVMSGQSLHFERGGRSYGMNLGWQPQWYLSYTGKRGVTKECVRRVKEMFAISPQQATELDQKMAKAVEDCESSLKCDSEQQGFEKLKLALTQACECFEKWGLTEGVVHSHLEKLKSAGAAAVKPTGSGDGGYALSLWREPPPSSLRDILIPCF